jgi:TonB family protein
LLADVASKVAADPSVPREDSASQTDVSADSGSTTAHIPAPAPAAADPPAVSVGSANQLANGDAFNGVLSAKASLPALSVPVSQGVSGGQLMRSVVPVYPVQARRLHVEGTVVLTAVVMEDGSVSHVKVVGGPATLVQSAVDAVKQRHYQPFELDGKPVQHETTISVDFKFPSDTPSR